MYCSGCGFALAQGQPVCPQCGRPVAPAAPPVPGMNFLVATYASKIKTLGIFWFVYAGLYLIFGFVGLTILQGVFGHARSWDTGQWNPGSWFFPAVVALAKVKVVLGSVLAAVVGWGLVQRAQWGRFVALVAAFLNLLNFPFGIFPFGTAIAIFTMVLLLGYRNTTLYAELKKVPVAY